MDDQGSTRAADGSGGSELGWGQVRSWPWGSAKLTNPWGHLAVPDHLHTGILWLLWCNEHVGPRGVLCPLSQTHPNSRLTQLSLCSLQNTALWPLSAHLSSLVSPHGQRVSGLGVRVLASSCSPHRQPDMVRCITQTHKFCSNHVRKGCWAPMRL